MVRKLKKQTRGFSDPLVDVKLELSKKTEETKAGNRPPGTQRNLRKRKRSVMKDISSISSQKCSDESYSGSGKKRKRKNSDQIGILMEFFKKNPRWDKHTVDKAAAKSGLARAQVYKWGWDRKKKAGPGELGFIKPAKDEFGGYSKHDFVDDVDPIADLLNIDLNHEIEKLDLIHKPKHTVSEPSRAGGSPMKGRNLVDSKKRVRKATMKELEVKMSPLKPDDSDLPKVKTLVKDAQVQTPTQKKLTSEDFMTPIKACRHLYEEEPSGLQKVSLALFAEPGDRSGSSAHLSERKVLKSSENSSNKKSKSGINTSDMKCSEVLTSREQNLQDENSCVVARYSKP